MIRRALSSPVRIAGAFAVAVTIFVGMWGTDDLESLYKFERAYGARYAGLAVGDMAVTSGVGSLGGVPVYDLTQGFGYRLPTQGSLGQSPLVFLRFVAGAELIQLLSLLPALFLCSWAVTSLLGRRGLGQSAARLGLAHVALLGPLFLFTIVNEWTPTAVSFCGRVTLIAAVLRLVVDGKRPWQTNEVVHWSFAVIAAYSFMAIGHPGEWPLAWPASIVLVFQVLLRLSNASDSLRHFATPLLPLALFALGVCAVFAISSYEIVYELGRPTTNSIRVAQGLALPGPKLPNIATLVGGESRASLVVLIVMSVMGPVVNLVQATNGRYEFVALGLIAVLAFSTRWWRGGGQHRLVRWSLGVILVTIVWWLAEVTSTLPTILRSSGAWLHAPQVLVTGVLGALCAGQLLRYSSRWGRSVIGVIVVGSLSMIVLQPLSLLSNTRPSRPDWDGALSASARFVPREIRATVVQLLPWRSVGSVTRGWVRAFEGFPVLESEPTYRNAATLSLRSGFGQIVSSKQLLEADFADFRDFASIDTVVGLAHDETNPAVPTPGEVMERVILPSGEQGVALRRRSFHTFTLERPQLASGEVRCPLLDDPACVTKVAPSQTEPRKEARWRLGKGGVLATYEWDVSRAAWAVLVPLDFDPALVVTDVESSDALRTHSHYGLLAVELPAGASSGVMQFTLRPDARMYARVLATYLHSIGLIVAVVSVCRRRRYVAESQTSD